MRIGIFLLLFSCLHLYPSTAQGVELPEQIERYYHQRNRLAAITTLDERLTLARADFDSSTTTPRLREALRLIDYVRQAEVEVDESMVRTPVSHYPFVQPALFQIISVSPISTEIMEATVRVLPLSHEQNLQLIALYESSEKQENTIDYALFLPESISIFRWTFEDGQWKVNPVHTTLLSQ